MKSPSDRREEDPRRLVWLRPSSGEASAPQKSEVGDAGGCLGGCCQGVGVVFGA